MFALLSQEEAIECYASNKYDDGIAEGLSQGLSQGLLSQLRSLKKFYPDFDSLYDSEISGNDTYNQFSKEDVYKLYLEV